MSNLRYVTCKSCRRHCVVVFNTDKTTFEILCEKCKVICGLESAAPAMLRGLFTLIDKVPL